MPDEAVIPAEGAVTPDAQVAPETPAVATSTAPASAKSTPEPAAQAPKPDLATLLSDPDLRQQLLEHPELIGEIDKRAKQRFLSERGRVRQEIEAEYEQRRQQEQAKRELQERLAMDELDLGVQYKETLQKQAEEQALEERLRPRQQEYEVNMLRQIGAQVFGSVTELAKELGVTEAELDEINPGKYPSLGEFTKAAFKFVSAREAKKLAKEMAKIEAKAMVEEERAKERESSSAPEILAPAEPGMNDSDFLASFPTMVRPSKEDYARARRLTGR